MLHVIFDKKGEVVWYQYCNQTDNFEKSASTFSWTLDRTIVDLLHNDKIIEVDLAGNEKFSLKHGKKGFEKKCAMKYKRTAQDIYMV